ncbi:MAG: H/ACA RNA-protein complex component Gar1 [Candidatus Diapherotrites archaeon]|nr:H/ACA RNA-protein complex component Gar1 [Candidatus Diapherotrites archaeon]
MRKVAVFLHRVGGNVVARIVDPRRVPRIGAPVFDERGKKLGIVADVIGRVDRPYAVIKGKDAPAYFTKEKFLLRGEING